MAKIDFALHLPVRYERRQASTVAFCDLLDVVAEGRDRPEAETRLVEALQLFIETCYFEGTLDEVLRNAGFTSVDGEQPGNDEDEEVIVPLSLVAAARGREARPR